MTDPPTDPPTDLARAVHDALNKTAGWPDDDRGADLLPPRGTGTLALPPGGLGPMPLRHALARRRSAYGFGREQPTLDDLATVLRLGLGTAPRAGGLPTLVPYVVARGAGPVPTGVHLADLRLPVPGLSTTRLGDPTAYVAASLDQPPFAHRVPLWIALVADLAVARGKYPARHYRTVHLDAGAALQNALLTATALGLNTCPVSGYDDRAWARLLDLPHDAFVTVLVALGRRP